MTFLYQSLLTIGLPLLALPLVIHLINLRRRRRIEWGAMQFLLESQKRNRRWIVLKQLLLLLMRTAAIALAVLMLAGPVIRSGWAALFGSGVTHHLILLDDSYSMADRWDETTAFDEAKRVVLQVLDQARKRAEDDEDDQLVTLVRFSEAKDVAAGAERPFDGQKLDAKTVANLERFLGSLGPSESAAGPVDVLQAAARLPEPTAGETRIAYLITDFRRPQWDEHAQLRQLVSRLRQRTSKLMLVQCTYDERPNFAITRLAPEAGMRAAGVDTWMEATVVNYGDAAATDVAVSLKQDGVDVAAVFIDEIPPGKETTQRFRMVFPEPGQRKIEARIESDAVATDNVRYFAARIPAAFPVLVVDGSPEGDDGYYLRNALSPGGRNLGGWSPQVEPPSFLRRHDKLADYAAIILLDVPRLDEPEAAALEDYVKAGGGLAIIAGPEIDRRFYNDRLYRDGEGLLPAPLDVPSQLLRDSRAATPDVSVTDHPIVRVFAGERNSFLAVAQVDFYFALDPEWRPPDDGSVQTLARLRNNAPLFMEKRYGRGRVIVGLTKLSPRPTELGPWSNLTLNPVFPVLANEMVGYLSASRRRFDVLGLDDPVRITVDEADYLPQMTVRRRGTSDLISLDSEISELSSEMQLGPLADLDDGPFEVVPTAAEGQYVVESPGKPHSGFWEFALTTREGQPETRVVAVNVPAGEGDLHLLPQDELAERLRGVDYDYSLASQFSEVSGRLEGSRVSDALLAALIAALVGEQLLAVSASYHARAEEGRMTAPVSNQVLAAAGDIVSYRLGRLDDFDDPRLAWAVIAAAAAVATLFVVWLYRRESESLPAWASVVLAGLRLVALAGAVVFFLQPLKRADQQEVTESRVAVLVDASQSMAVEDETLAGEPGASRSDAAIAALTDGKMLEALRAQHDVSLWTFDAGWRRVGQWNRQKLSVAGPPRTDDAFNRRDSIVVEREQLTPLGAETRLGDALGAAFADPAGGPLAGMLVLSDGGQNRGFDPLAATDALAAAKAPLAVVGLGSTEPRRNVRIQDLVAPSRAYPEDKAVIRAIVQGESYNGRSVNVELWAREGSPDAAAVRVGEAQAAFEGDTDTVEVEFEIEPAAVGRLELEARVDAPEDDQVADDNQRAAEIEIVDASTRVLLVASGPTRDYRFLRNQLKRDRHATVDVLLQGTPPGISQDADKILEAFPTTKEELFKYDCLVAFDADWLELDAGQVALVEEWVAQEAGGMIVVAGPVNAAGWLQSPEHGKVRALYPVEFQRRLTLLDDGLFGSKRAWPLEFTREGQEADFLWLGDSPQESRANWQKFPGVFGCYAVRGPKPGAQVYARYSDPDAGLLAEQPVYLADHFYGAGRVFYMGSGELWRLRAVDPGFFEILYTQLVRHVSAGRLLRGSSFGRLLVERDRYFVGDTVVVRAQLSTSSREPYVAKSVKARVAQPAPGSRLGRVRDADDAGEDVRTVELVADATRPGNFIGQFTVSSEGLYRIELAVPDAPDEPLVKRITATAPDLEFVDTRRNEALLEALATRTGGRYYETTELAVRGASGVPPLVELLPSRAETRIRIGKPDEAFTERVNRVLLGVICGALCTEWLLRRLLKLA